MLISLLLAGGVLLGQVQQDTPPELAKKIQTLVRQLESDKFVERDNADKQLRALGPKALEELERIEKAKGKKLTEDVKHRLGGIRLSLEYKRAEQSVKASVVNLSAQAMPFAKFLAELEKQTGNKILASEDFELPKVNVAFKDTPFWEALDRTLDQAKLTFYPFPSDEEVRIQSRPDGERSRFSRASYFGAFRFETTAILLRRDLRVKSNKTLTLTLKVGWEPRLKPLAISLKSIRAVDEKGKTIDVDSSAPSSRVPVHSGTSAVEMRIFLVAPPRSVNKIASVKGKLQVLVPSSIETFRFSDLDKANEKSKARVTVTMEKVRKNNLIWEIHIRVRYEDAKGALDSHLDWDSKSNAYIEGPNKKQIEWGNRAVQRIGPNELGIKYYFELEGGPEGHSFVYQTPGDIIPLDVEFELKDLELP